MSQLDVLLNQIKTLVRDDRAVPALEVDDGTLICIKEDVPLNPKYWQVEFEQFDERVKAILRNKPKGFKIQGFKIIAIWHIWEDAA